MAGALGITRRTAAMVPVCLALSCTAGTIGPSSSQQSSNGPTSGALAASGAAAGGAGVGGSGGNGGVPPLATTGSASSGLAATADGAAPGAPYIDPLSTALTRLTNAEYSRTVTDLTGEPPGAAVTYMFPVDTLSHGFDNNASLLQLTTAHATQYATAAAAIATATFADATRRPKVISCDPTAATCLPAYVAAQGRRMFRRPLIAAEVTAYVTLGTNAAVAGSPYSGPETVLEAMLQSPNFLFKVLLGGSPAGSPTVIGLNGFEMATRLAYLLWGTTPDDPLLDQAQAGALDTAAGVATVVGQMLADARARPGIKHFYEQWLPMSEISGPMADVGRVPVRPGKTTPDTQLAADMVEETRQFVDDVLWGGGSLLGLLTAQYTFVNADMAAIYGVAAPATGWQKVTFPATSLRSGVLTQGTVLAAGSHGTKPSYTRRGQMVREQLLCQDIPPPPPGVDATVPAPNPGESEQQTFARHTTDPSCASCHAMMDPIGFGLSGFDQTGAARTLDSNGQPISTQGKVQGMTPPDFNGPVQLGQKVATSDLFKGCFATQLFRYAYGRVEDSKLDVPGVDAMQASFEGGQWSFAQGLTALLESQGFRYRQRGDQP
jgi:hypothetical protein